MATTRQGEEARRKGQKRDQLCELNSRRTTRRLPFSSRGKTLLRVENKYFSPSFSRATGQPAGPTQLSSEHTVALSLSLWLSSSSALLVENRIISVIYIKLQFSSRRGKKRENSLSNSCFFLCWRHAADNPRAVPTHLFPRKYIDTGYKRKSQQRERANVRKTVFVKLVFPSK